MANAGRLEERKIRTPNRDEDPQAIRESSRVIGQESARKARS